MTTPRTAATDPKPVDAPVLAAIRGIPATRADILTRNRLRDQRLWQEGLLRIYGPQHRHLAGEANDGTCQ